MTEQLIQAEAVMASHPEHRRMAHDPGCEEGTAFVDGDFTPLAQAGVPLVDTGFIHADAAYDVVSASRGLVFRLQDHVERFLASCGSFRLNCPYDARELAAILLEMTARSGFRDAYIWWCVSRGIMPHGPDRADPEAYTCRFYGFVIPYLFIAGDEARNRGLNLWVSRRYQRIPAQSVDPSAKNFHWMDMKLALFEATDNGCDYAVLCDGDGFLTESPGSNIFLLSDGVLHTPEAGCLPGITRATVLELAEELDIPVQCGTLPAGELDTAQEVFVTSTAGGIMPVTRLAGKPVAGASPGPVTTALHNRYWEKRWSGWYGTEVEYTGGAETLDTSRESAAGGTNTV